MIPREILRNPWVKTTLIVGALGFTLWLGYLIWDVLALFLLAFFFAYLLDPAADWVEEMLNVGRVAAVILLLTVITCLAVVLGYFLTNQLIVATQKVAEINFELDKVVKWLKSILPARLGQNVEPLIQRLESRQLFDLQKVAEYLRSNLTNVSQTLQRGSFVLVGFARQTLGVIGVVVNLLVLIFATIYFLKDFDDLITNVRKLIPHHLRPGADELFADIDELLRAFFRGHLIVCITIGILYGSGYLLLGLEGGFLVGFLSGLMNIIPYVGPSLGFLLAVGLALYQFGIGLKLGGILLVFVVVQSIEGNILTPNIVGGAVGLNPVTVIFALLVFGKLFGFLGLLLAIPCAGVLKVIFKRLLRYYRSTEFFRSPPQPRS